MRKLFLPAVTMLIVFSSCGGPQKNELLCKCVNEKWESGEEEKECKEMKYEWVKDYDQADEATKKKMKEEIDLCH